MSIVSKTTAQAFIAATEFAESTDFTLRDTPMRDIGSPAIDQPIDFQALKNQAMVVGSEVVSFVKGVSAQRRKDIVNSALFAQLYANKQVPARERMFDWYNAYFNALTQIGWVIQSSAFDTYHEESAGVDAHEAILKVAAVVLGGAPTALAVVTSTINALKEMDSDNPWLTLFNKESMSAHTAHFQVTLADESEDGKFLVTQMAFALDAQSQLTQVLFFRVRKNALSLQHCSGSVTINEDVLDFVRDDLQAKLAQKAKGFIGEVDI